jgi:hypothetical protein
MIGEILASIDHKITTPSYFKDVITSIAGIVSLKKKEEPAVIEAAKPSPWERMMHYVGKIMGEDPRVLAYIGHGVAPAMPTNKVWDRFDFSLVRAAA